MLIAVTFFVVIVAALVGYLMISVYNALVSLNEQVGRAWANIDVILKQRFDEVPQLIQIIEQYTSYERQTLEKIISLRSRYLNTNSVEEKVDIANESSPLISGLIGLGEAYPDLKAIDSYSHILQRLSEFEDKIADRRENFNETVTNYNIRIQQFPDLFFAGMLGYTRKTMYRPDESQTQKPDLKINRGI